MDIKKEAETNYLSILTRPHLMWKLERVLTWTFMFKLLPACWLVHSFIWDENFHWQATPRSTK